MGTVNWALVLFTNFQCSAEAIDLKAFGIWIFQKKNYRKLIEEYWIN